MLEQFLQMLDEAGIKYEYNDKPGKYGNVEYAEEIFIQNTKGQGYSGFFSAWSFDAKGKLIAVGHYE